MQRYLSTKNTTEGKKLLSKRARDWNKSLLMNGWTSPNPARAIDLVGRPGEGWGREAPRGGEESNAWT